MTDSISHKIDIINTFSNFFTNFFLCEGPYGSGKTIVCQKILENILPSLDTEKDMLFYIIFDQYSLLYAETHLYCENLKKKYSNFEIVCWNISEVCTKSFTLSECLENLTKISTDKGKRLHVFIDEYDSEDLTENECILLNTAINNNFASSYLIIVMQSIQKYRSFYDLTSNKSIKISTHRFNVLEESMKFLQLTKVMRFTETIFGINQNVQSYVKSKENQYHDPMGISTVNDFKDEHHSPSSPSSISDRENEMINKSESETVFYDSTDGKPSPSSPVVVEDDENYPNINTKVPIDRLIKQTNAGGSKRDIASNLILGTNFGFHRAKGCGHAIKGSIPSLIRIPYTTSTDKIASAILKVSKPNWERSLFICNDIHLVGTVYSAILNLNLEVIVHISGLTREPFDSNDMVYLYDKWINTPDSCVLLTDNMGCRGLQNENVCSYFRFTVFSEISKTQNI